MSSVNGAELSSVEQGLGGPVVFVHGSLSDFRSWRLQMAPLTERYRAIAYSRCRH
jgi:pimeloyl-ACP methyl ester carboxylesterase